MYSGTQNNGRRHILVLYEESYALLSVISTLKSHNYRIPCVKHSEVMLYAFGDRTDVHDPIYLAAYIPSNLLILEFDLLQLNTSE